MPSFVPALGSLVCLALLVNRVATGDWRALDSAWAVLAAIAALHMAAPPRDVLPAVD